MKRKGIAGVSLALALALPLTAFAACAPQDPATGGDGGTTEELPLTPDYGIADQQYLYGLCYLLEERDYTGSPFTEDDIETEVQLMQNLGVRTVRHWIHCTTYMLDKETMNEEACETMHAVLAACEDAGIVNIGMNHHNFNNGMSTVGKLRRNMVPGSDYLLWLEDYYTTWYHLVSEFPEVQYWEIDNELNNPDFMFDAETNGRFTSEEMAAIATDMLWYASRGIHDANPDAVAVMGGLTERFGLGNSDTENGDPSMQWFLQAIYDNIASGEYGRFYATQGEEQSSLDPDDYFQVVNWHPYVWDLTPLDEDSFVEKNNAIYDVVLENEGKHKKVFLSEIGFSDFGRGQTVAAQSVTNLYHAVSTRMPYVETVNLFKMYDVARDSWGGAGEQDNGYARYGLFYDPDPSRVYYRLDEENPTQTTDELCVPAAPKLTAYAFQTAAGGSGSLTLLSEQQ